jgi:hypothetical protein
MGREKGEGREGEGREGEGGRWGEYSGSGKGEGGEGWKWRESKLTLQMYSIFYSFCPVSPSGKGKTEGSKRNFCCGIVAKLFKNKGMLTFYKRSSKSRHIHTKNAN